MWRWAFEAEQLAAAEPERERKNDLLIDVFGLIRRSRASFTRGVI